jgi:hypothetical protein
MWVRCCQICIFWVLHPGSGGMKDSKGGLDTLAMKEWNGRKLGHVRHRFIMDFSGLHLVSLALPFFPSDINIMTFLLLPRLYVSIFVRISWFDDVSERQSPGDEIVLVRFS